MGTSDTISVFESEQMRNRRLARGPIDSSRSMTNTQLEQLTLDKVAMRQNDTHALMDDRFFDKGMRVAMTPSRIVAEETEIAR